MRQIAANYGRQSRGKKKSISDQLKLGHELCVERGWDERVYSDRVSASWFGTKRRGGWEELLADLVAGLLDVLILWESSRGDRRNTEWSRMLDICVERGIRIHIIEHERTYDPRIARDWETLASEGVKSQSEVLKLSGRVRRGVDLAAKAGRPAAGPAPYGYVRTYDPRTGELTGQEPCPETAGVARRIVRDVGRGVPLSELGRKLQEEAVPPPGARSHGSESMRWHRERIREIAINPVYAGLRRHQEKGAYRGQGQGQRFGGTWPALVTEAEHLAAVRVLTEPSRVSHGEKSSRPGKQAWLLTYLAECHRGHAIVARRAGRFLACAPGCVQIPREPVDELVEATMVEALASPELYAKLKHADAGTSAMIADAELEIERLEMRLKEFRASAAEGETSPRSLREIEDKLVPKIEAARRRSSAVGIPDALRPFLEPGADVEARWDAATLHARRAVIRALARVVIKPAPVAGRRAPVGDRVDVLPAEITLAE